MQEEGLSLCSSQVRPFLSLGSTHSTAAVCQGFHSGDASELLMALGTDVFAASAERVLHLGSPSFR